MRSPKDTGEEMGEPVRSTEGTGEEMVRSPEGTGEEMGEVPEGHWGRDG